MLMSIRPYVAHTKKAIAATPQTQPLASGTPQVQNNAGGFVYDTGIWPAFERFLILGSEGGTYYVSEHKLTADNAKNAIKCVVADTKKAVDLIIAVSDAGRAPKNDPAIFALALAAAHGDKAGRKYALASLSKVCRIPTHLFHFVTFLKDMRGTGRAVRRAYAEWYAAFPVEKLAYELVKYQSRDGWSNADVLRFAHPQTTEKARHAVYRWALGLELGKRSVMRAQSTQPSDKKAKFNLKTKRWEVVRNYKATGDVPEIILGFEAAKAATSAKQVIKAIKDYKLTREMLPTEALTYPEVWATLLDNGMPYTALIRNLGNLSKHKVLTPNSDAAKTIVKQLADGVALRKARVHPLAILVALKMYEQGAGLRGKGTWDPVLRVVDALDAAFYDAFGNIEPTGKRLLFGIDVSGSMSSRFGDSPLSSAEAAAAMAMICAKTEQEYYIHGFAGNFVKLPITPSMRLDEVLQITDMSNFGTTDASLPMKHAEKNKIPVDGFIVITDNETWSGSTHPSQALKSYRKVMQIDAKEVVIATSATEFTIADPNDPRTLDVVGFDTATPQIIAEFLRG
jgi:60 kDa SS-A/Ro ribonucleoprotein